MNNKGQTLAFFVLILPIIIILLALILDYGLLSVEKRNISSSVKSCIKYGFNDLGSGDKVNKMTDLLYKNVDRDRIKRLSIVVDGDSIFLDIVVSYDSIFKLVNNDIKLSYVGHISADKISVEKR